VGLNAQAYDWVETLPVAMRRTGEASPFVALCYTDTGHWRELHDLIKDANWGGSEYLRNAFLARAAEKLGNGTEFDSASNTAMAEATGNAQAQRLLAQTELDWGWQGEAQLTLSDIVRTSDNGASLDWALKNLYGMYQKKGDVVQLAAVTQKMAELKPDDDIIKNNFVMFSLLTRSNLLSVLPLAEALYKRHSADPVFVSTYAYSLLVRGDKDKAMAVIMTLPDEDKRSSPVSAYCGIILAANKEKETAKTYLDLVDESKLLPQEVILVNAARTQIR
jgi:Flp pilus assembly protein TadD